MPDLRLIEVSDVSIFRLTEYGFEVPLSVHGDLRLFRPQRRTPKDLLRRSPIPGLSAPLEFKKPFKTAARI